jgi:hypothetical protein
MSPWQTIALMTVFFADVGVFLILLRAELEDLRAARRARTTLSTASPLDHGIELRLEPSERSREPRFADARFAGKEHHLAFTGHRPRPTPQQELGLFLPPDERGQPARVLRVKTALHFARARHLPCLHWIGQPLQHHLAQIAVLEQAAREAASGVRNHYLTRLSERLQSGSDVRCLTHDAALLRIALTDQITDDDQSGCNTDPHLKRCIADTAEL